MCNAYALNLVKRMDWFTMAKALDRSNINVPTIWLLSMAVIQSSILRISQGLTRMIFSKTRLSTIE